MSADDDALLAALLGKTDGTVIDQIDAALAKAWTLSSGLDFTVPTSGGSPGPYRAGGTPWDLAVDQVTARFGAAPKARTLTEKVALLVALVQGIDAKRTAPTPDPGTGTGGGTGGGRFVPPGAKVTWSASFDGASSLSGAAYNADDWEWEPKDARGTRIPAVVNDPTGAGRGKVLSAYIPGGLGAKGRSEAHPKAPNARAGTVAYFGYDVFVKSAPSGPSAWGGDVLTQYAQGGYTPALEIKLNQGKLKFDGNGSGWHVDIGDLPTGRWVNFAARVAFSTSDKTSRLDAWLDGKQVVTNAKPSGAGTIYGGGHNPYPKHGAYAAPGRGLEVLYDNAWWGTEGN